MFKTENRIQNNFKIINLNNFLLFLPIFFILWPLFNYDWEPVNEIIINKRQLTTYLSKSANFFNLDKYCPLMATNLDEYFIDSYSFDKNISEYDISELYWIQTGGKYNPKHCISRNKVAILIPSKNQNDYLNIIVPYLHSFVSPQLVNYRIFVITTINKALFNKGILYNAAFIEINKLENFNCFIFHDHNLLPENQFNLYSCSNVPRHLSVRINSLRYILPYRKSISGVFSILTKHFQKINGFSNKFYEWIGEYHDFYKRISFYNFSILRSEDIGTYTTLSFNYFEKTDFKESLLKNSNKNMFLDGLNDIKYKLLNIEEKLLYTIIKIDHS